ncbi:DUF805 domain-containing protein [Sphingomonas trueperi]|uniref:DUF805 domain-containing protein n=1 Tax=Sphingomonas trueperi TaxID=53317 RepID=UPI000EB573DC
MEWMFLPLKRYADFQGRSRRLEYWMFALLMFLAVLVWAGVFVAVAGVGGFQAGAMSNLATIWVFAGVLAYLAILIPAIAVQVRRFHDRDMSGWFVLLNFIPYVGGLIAFVFMVLPGTPGENRFGPDPKDPDNVASMAEVFG